MTEYNPMSKEFQDECEKLGLTGRQLTAKYQKEGKFVKKELRKSHERYTKEELKSKLRQFEKKEGRPPTEGDFTYNSDYPSFMTYVNRFGSWKKALKLVGMDLDTRVMQKGNLNTKKEKGRRIEIVVTEMFSHKGIDLSGENCNNYFDGICPNGQTYEVKSGGLSDHKGWLYWHYSTKNNDKDDNVDAIQWWYLIAMNKDYTKLLYMWRVPGELIEADDIYIGMYKGKFNVGNMINYDITDKVKDILKGD